VESDWPDRGGHLWPKDRLALAPDGTRVAYTVRGPVGSPALLMCAGYLCPDNFWRDLGPDLARDHRVVVLNYRGIGASSEAGGHRLPSAADDYTIERLATDVAAVADAEGLTSTTVVGHSMGVQVALALWQARPDLVGRLALLAGPFASPFHTFYGNGAAAAVFPAISMVVPALPRALTGRAMRALELPGTIPLARAIHALGPNTPAEGMRSYRWHLGRIDPRTAIWTARGMHAFDASAYLDAIDVPTLVAVGDLDAWAPASVGERLAEALPDAELVVLPGGSHGLPIEFPVVLAARIRALTAPLRVDGRARVDHTAQ